MFLAVPCAILRSHYKTVVVLAIYKNLSQNDNCILQKLENVLKYVLGFLEYREYAKQTFLNRITSH